MYGIRVLTCGGDAALQLDNTSHPSYSAPGTICSVSGGTTTRAGAFDSHCQERFSRSPYHFARWWAETILEPAEPIFKQTKMMIQRIWTSGHHVSHPREAEQGQKTRVYVPRATKHNEIPNTAQTALHEFASIGNVINVELINMSAHFNNKDTLINTCKKTSNTSATSNEHILVSKND